ncbi:GerAB/ArcD/ProY family transporter [Neobacillus sp. M.A.Huq-85]|nr:endospore germination permease [Neobacillus cucumis]
MQNLTKILIPRQLFLLLVLSTGLMNHVILIPNLLTVAGRDSWLSVIAAYLIALLSLPIIYFILKNSPDGGFFPAVRHRFGAFFSVLLSVPVILFLLISTYITFRDFMVWLKSYFLADYSEFMIKILLLVLCFIITLAGIKAMAITSGFLVPFVVLFGIFIAISNTSMKEPGYLFPVLAEGFSPFWKGVVLSLSGLLEMYLVILLQPFSQASIKFRQLFILVTFLTILILGPLTAAIMEFGPQEAIQLRYPAYEEWRILSIGEYITHLDFLALYQWMCGGLTRISLFMYLIGTLLTGKTRHYRLHPVLVGVLYLILFVLMMIPWETYNFNKAVLLYVLPSCMVFFLTYTLVSALLLFILKRKEGQHEKKNGAEPAS